MVTRQGAAFSSVQFHQAMWLKISSTEGVSCKIINFRHSLSVSLNLGLQSQVTVSRITRSSVSVSVFVWGIVKLQGCNGHPILWTFDVIWTNLCKIKQIANVFMLFNSHCLVELDTWKGGSLPNHHQFCITITKFGTKLKKN